MAWLMPAQENPIAWIGMAVLAFVLFRIFDVWKPWIIDKSQHLPSGWGVLTDDILAGIFAGILVLIPATLLY
jgi:phosphatidylglycerophosphatase A